MSAIDDLIVWLTDTMGVPEEYHQVFEDMSARALAEYNTMQDFASDVVFQFGLESTTMHDGKPTFAIGSGGLSTVEWGMELLGYEDDPQPLPDMTCNAPYCGNRFAATLLDGLRLCPKHYWSRIHDHTRNDEAPVR